MQDRTRVGGTGPSRSRASASSAARPATKPATCAIPRRARPDRRPRGRGTPPGARPRSPLGWRRRRRRPRRSRAGASPRTSPPRTTARAPAPPGRRPRRPPSPGGCRRPRRRRRSGRRWGRGPVRLSGRRVGEVVDRERGDHGVERAVAEGRSSHRPRPVADGSFVPQHPDGDVDGDGGSSAGRLGRPARGSGTGAEIEHARPATPPGQWSTSTSLSWS